MNQPDHPLMRGTLWGFPVLRSGLRPLCKLAGPGQFVLGDGRVEAIREGTVIFAPEAHRIPVCHDNGDVRFVGDFVEVRRHRCPDCGATQIHARDYVRAAVAIIHGDGEAARACTFSQLQHDPQFFARWLGELHARSGERARL